jgi:hypothetical protein
MGRLWRWIRTVLSRSERFQMWYLERDLVALRRDYHRELAEARRPSGPADRSEIESRYASETALVQEELEGIRTDRILRRARALRVPPPSARPHGHDFESADENWSLGSIMGQWTLTAEGETRLRRAIRAEEKARRETAAFWLGMVTGLIALVTGLVAAATGLIAIQQKELSRLDHLPRISSFVVRSLDEDSLIVSNSGSPVRRMTVDRLVFFDVQPYSRPAEPKLVRYVIDDYYPDQLGPDYEGNQRLAFGRAQPRQNLKVVRGVTSALVDSLTRHGLGWAGIEVRRAIRVVYWDWLGTRIEEYFWGHAAAGEVPSQMERISRKRWRMLKASADSVRRTGRKLQCAATTLDSDTRRVVRECISAALK